MLHIIGNSLKGFLKIKRHENDCQMFRVHHRYTVLILMVFCIVVTSTQLVGDSIKCMAHADVPQEVLDLYCWIHATYTVKSAYKKQVGKTVPHPGIYASEEKSNHLYHSYYHWVCFMLFFQGFLFYIPRWVWKNLEQGKVEQILKIAGTDPESKAVVEHMRIRWHESNSYPLKYFSCEILSFINVTGQMFLLNYFFGDQFLTLGIEAITNEQNALLKIFPRVSQCDFRMVAPNGYLNTFDVLCLLPINVFTEKVYIFLWWWFVFLIGLTGVTLLYRVTTFVVPAVRLLVLRIHAQRIDADELQSLVRRSTLGDWFLLYVLCQNMDQVEYCTLVTNISKRIGVPNDV